jgi:hypothetical protein
LWGWGVNGAETFNDNQITGLSGRRTDATTDSRGQQRVHRSGRNHAVWIAWAAIKFRVAKSTLARARAAVFGHSSTEFPASS